MDFKKYGIVYLLIILVAALFIASRIYPDIRLNTFIPTASPVSSPSQAVTVVVDNGDKQKTYTNVTAPNAYLALVEAVKQDNLEVGTKQYDFGILVTSIGTYVNSTAKAWIYYVNGKSGDVSADKKLVAVGDKVEWKYVKPQ